MQNFVRNLTEQFEKIESVYDIPNFRVVDRLYLALRDKIPLVVLGKALGRAKINVQTFDQVEVLDQNGFLNQSARMLLMLYEYSMTTFGAADFFIEACSSFEIELKGG